MLKNYCFQYKTSLDGTLSISLRNDVLFSGYEWVSVCIYLFIIYQKSYLKVLWYHAMNSILSSDYYKMYFHNYDIILSPNDISDEQLTKIIQV